MIKINTYNKTKIKPQKKKKGRKEQRYKKVVVNMSKSIQTAIAFSLIFQLTLKFFMLDTSESHHQMEVHL